MTLAESYYKVGNDMARQAGEMMRTAEMLLRIADRMSEENMRMCRELNERNEKDVADSVEPIV